MLRSTFRHLPGIGAKKEAALWQSGVTTLDALRELWRRPEHQLRLFEALAPEGNDPVQLSIDALGHADAAYFAHLLDHSEQYRIALTYPHETLFLDIETTGLSHFYDIVTVVGWSLDGTYQYWIRGTRPAALYAAAARAKVIVTFNGTIFDLPFLRAEFADLVLPKAHVDLRFFARRVGLSGPQKDIEQQIKMRRPRAIATLRGEAAPLLWHEYIRGDDSACRRLIAYNKADIDGMRRILDVAIRLYTKKSGIPHHIRRTAAFRFARLDRAKPLEITIPKPRQARIATNPHPTKLRDLASATAGVATVVGIDLTGSERRPTGWALLSGRHATTKRLASDAELIEATLAVNPTLVSIDSPLSLPRGRTRVTDDDPARKQYGIMRECERVLHRRGVNVYPSLIQSMQALTARGIRLAAEFRKRGIPVIESFPGAAQDIMGIPRKRSDLRLLSQGLHDFGVDGTFTHETVSHDELDAITSAIVGAFFWAGQFEALGNPDEEYLIIPAREPLNRWGDHIVVGLSGPIDAGKTTAGEFLVAKDFYYTRFSLVLRLILEARGEEATRPALQRFGQDIHERLGQRWLEGQLIANIPPARRVVIDGLRWPEDHAYLVESFGPKFQHIYIDAEESVRRERHLKNGGSLSSFEEAISHPVEAKTLLMQTFARTTIANNGTLADMRRTLLHTLSLTEVEYAVNANA
jgi:uncharacterized protein YprB with RNaseH-like and TPR domain/predicted nuclease with RNAse H fold/dephospho-CoA kinase